MKNRLLALTFVLLLAGCSSCPVPSSSVPMGRDHILSQFEQAKVGDEGYTTVTRERIEHLARVFRARLMPPLGDRWDCEDDASLFRMYAVEDHRFHGRAQGGIAIGEVWAHMQVGAKRRYHAINVGILEDETTVFFDVRSVNFWVDRSAIHTIEHVRF